MDLYTTPGGIVLRDYQVEAVDKLRAGLRSGEQWQMLVAPTGAGKTVMAGDIIRGANAKNSRVGFFVDRIALVSQTSLRMHEAGIPHGVVQGSNSYGRDEQIKIYSAQTFERLSIPPRLDLAVYDECHTVRRKTVEKLKAMNIPVIGLTASPFTRGLGKLYTGLVNARTTNQLISEGHLVPPRVFIAKRDAQIDMSNTPVNSMGEWNGRDVEKKAIAIAGDIVAEWVRHTNRIFGGPVKTLLFSATVNDGAEYARQFQALGYKFEQISYLEDTDETRDRKIDMFRRGELHGLISCDALAKGFDVPDVLCIIGARPYRKGFASHIQQVGRGMRPAPGKEYFLYLDHTYPSNWDRFALALESFWGEGCKGLSDRDIKDTIERENTEYSRECVKCGYYRAPGESTCTQCGHVHERSKKSKTEHVDGRMEEYKTVTQQLGDVWPDICYLAREKHPLDAEKALRFAKAQYKGITGTWPFNRYLLDPDRCDPRVREIVHQRYKSWLHQKRREGYAKRKSRG